MLTNEATKDVKFIVTMSTPMINKHRSMSLHSYTVVVLIACPSNHYVRPDLSAAKDDHTQNAHDETFSADVSRKSISPLDKFMHYCILLVNSIIRSTCVISYICSHMF